MKTSQSNEQLIGGLAAVSAYFLWGVMPIYWKQLTVADFREVLAERIIWSFVFMLIVLLLTKNMKPLFHDIRALIAAPKRLLSIIAAAFVITVNWYIFIWAVDQNHVVQASLGYYINPLISVLLGIFFLKERLSMWQVASFLLALIGVLIMTFQAGVFPWISLTLAISFALYGLLKKTVQLKAMTGLTIETFIASPAALLFILAFNFNETKIMHADPMVNMLLIGSGVITAVPLLLFATGANRISLAMVGFFQYIAPTIMLILGTLLYHEPFDHEHLVSFMLIWISLILFSLSRTKWFIRLENMMFRKKLAPVQESKL